MPRCITYANMVLKPKKENVSRFSDLRPIIFSAFMNKSMSREIHEILVEVLHRIIFNNQSSFIKGRSIAENVLLAQEIIRDFNKETSIII